MQRLGLNLAELLAYRRADEAMGLRCRLVPVLAQVLIAERQRAVLNAGLWRRVRRRQRLRCRRGRCGCRAAGLDLRAVAHPDVGAAELGIRDRHAVEDVGFGDVLHSMPVADSKLGGSYVWVRDSAQIKSGSATTAAPAAAPQALAAANAPPQTGVQDCTLAFCDQNLRQNWNQPTPQTHCFICPPISQQLCQIQTQPLHCQTQPVVFGILPPSFNCTQQGCGAGVQPGGQQAQLHAMAVQPTPSAVHQCGGGGVHPTPSAVHQCGGVHPTLATLCTQPHLCPPQAPGMVMASPPCPSLGCSMFGTCAGCAQPAPQAAGPQMQAPAMAGPPGTAMFSWPAQCPSQFCSAVGTCGQAPQAAGPQMHAQAMAGPPGTAMFYCTMNCGGQIAPAMPMASQLLCTPFDGCAAPQAAAAVQPTPSAVHHCGQPLTQGICPTPSAINQCGQPLTQGICPTPSAINLCGQPFTQGICPTLSAIHLCGQPLTQGICATPTATQPGFCQPTGIACLATQGCVTVPNGVFTPFGRG